MREYAFLMVDYKTPEFIKNLHSKIKENELYVEENSDYYGLEQETHVTVAACLENDVDYKKLKKYLKPLKQYKIVLSSISVFENENYDVLKCDTHSEILNDTNKAILNDYKSYSQFKDYHPHITIAYLKKGVGEKYKQKTITPLVVLEPTNFHFSFKDNDGKDKEIKFS